jgi:anti-sigma B factor antagonist
MMTIEKILNGTELTVTITGRLDTTTAPQLEAEFKQNIGGVEKLVLDFTALEYLSSAGLRVLLAAQKVMNKQGEMIIRNVNETINEIFEVTGFIDILTIE